MEQEQEEIKLDGFIQLQKALRQIEREESQPLQEEITSSNQRRRQSRQSWMPI